LAPTDSPSLDISPVFDAIAVFLIPGIINAFIGGIVHSYPAPSLPGNLSRGLGGVIAQAFPPKLYLEGVQEDGARKLILQYEGVVTGADFGVQAYGSTSPPRVRTPILTLTSELGFGPVRTSRPVGGDDGGGGGPPWPTKLIVVATTDDMRDPTISFVAHLRHLSVTDPQPSADGTRFTSVATFAAPHRKTTVTLVVTAMDADQLTVSQSLSVDFSGVDSPEAESSE
jgi:hypothetical protein